MHWMSIIGYIGKNFTRVAILGIRENFVRDEIVM